MLQGRQIESARLGDLCDIIVGMPLSRARRIPESSHGEVMGVVTQKALTPDGIDDGEIARETLGNVRDACVTAPGDVIVKLTTPYDCAYVDDAHAGLLVISAAAILRPRTGAVNMRWIAAVLSMPQLKVELRLASIGSSIQMLKKAGLSDLAIPVPSVEEQERVGAVHARVASLKGACRRSMRLADALLASSVNDAAFALTDTTTER